jgi:hypothetical protein
MSNSLVDHRRARTHVLGRDVQADDLPHVRQSLLRSASFGLFYRTLFYPLPGTHGYRGVGACDRQS